MYLQRLMLVLFATCAALAACSRAAPVTDYDRRHLTVWGPKARVENFAKLQGSRTPALAVSAIKSLGSGRAETTVTFAASYTSKDLIQTTREAQAADLDYRFEEHKSTTTTHY